MDLEFGLIVRFFLDTNTCCPFRLINRCCSRPISTTFAPQATATALRDFFDDEANFGKSELRPKKRPGRSWTADELRLKSNSDLHKLW